MFTTQRISQVFVGSLAVLCMAGAQAQISQTPLLTQTGSVEPNLVLMFDDSASMPAQFLYQYGGSEGVYGRDGPGSTSNTASCPATLAMETTCTYSAPTMNLATGVWVSTSAYASGTMVYSPANFESYKRTNSGSATSSTDPSADSSRWTKQTNEFAQLSPDVNRLAYDPRILYKRRVTATGSLSAAAPTTAATIYVFFYKNGTTGKNEVWPGKITNPAGAPYRDPLTAAAYFIPNIAASNLDASNPYSALASGAEAGLVYPNAVTSSYAAHLPKFVNRTDCTGTYCTLANEQQNYANYLKYHSNRLDLAKTGLGWAFQDVTATLRLGWGVINTMSGGSLGTTTTLTSSTAGSGVGLYDSARKADFYTWLYARTGTVGGTPSRLALKTVGNYFTRADGKGPWANTPDVTSLGSSTLATSNGDQAADRAKHYSCRRNYAMLITDGYYNDNTASVGVGNVDSTGITAITGTDPAGTTSLSYAYNGNKNPYSGGGTDTMADVAMKYWITDLRTDLPNNAKTATNNESFWQNMSFYGVGLGVYGTLPQTAATLANLSATPQIANTNSVGTAVTGWPTAAGNQEEAMDDMWHATINGRGRLLSAKNSDELSDAVEGMLADINRVDSSQSGVAASAAALTTNTRKYTPRYVTGAWSGDVIATNLDPKSAADTCIAWQVTGASSENTTLLPNCAGFSTNGIPAYGARNIYAWNGSGYGSFDSANSYVTSNVVGGSNANLINFLRGDQSNEDITVNGIITTPKSFRTRTKVLGDIVNSTPTFIGGALDMGYDKLPAGSYGQSSYKAFVTSKKARTEGVLFAGANDGMLHGFRDSNGAEAFAFVPRAVMPNLHLLASRSYNHTYYVDGTTTEVDACLSGGSACSTWSNLLIGSLGAGGKEVFAIDVTNLTPSSTMGLSAANIKWEIASSSSGFANLGNTLSDIQTGVLTDGTWVAVFGNGYYGADGRAHLYVANLNTGALIKDIDTGVGSGNGLSGATLVLDTNKRIVGAYAGDLKGNLWKFDLTSGSALASSNCCLGLSGAPLYAAGSSKPITAPPAIVDHPNGGKVVTFGTGKLFDTGDTAAGSQQSFYGIWDSVGFANPMPATPIGVAQVEANRASKLVNQTLGAAIAGTYTSTKADGTTSSVNLNGYSQTKNTIDWTTKRGWYLDMLASGERMVYPMASLFGRLVLAYSISPSSSTDPCTQTQSGKAWSYIFDLLSGARPDNSVYPGCADCSKLELPKGPIGPPVVICQDGSTASCYALPPTDCRAGDTTCNSPPEIKKFCGAQTGIPCATTVKRTWRQLFMR